MLGKERLRLLTTQCWLFLTVTHSRAGEEHSDFALIQVCHCANSVLPSECCFADSEDYDFVVVVESVTEFYFTAYFYYKGNFVKILCVHYMKPERILCVCVCVLQRQQ